MDLVTSIILALVVCVLMIYMWSRRPDPRLPPCPTRPWPIVGHLFILKEDPRPQFTKWREEIGDIFSLYMGGTLMVVFNGYDLLKETLIKRAGEFSERPPEFFIDEATGIPKKGVIMSSGALWKEQRAFTMSALRAFGMGKNLQAENIHGEVGYYLEKLSKLNGEATDLRVLTNISTANVVCSIIIGQRFEYDDQTFQDLMTKLHYIAADLGGINLVTFLPWLRYLPGDLFKAKKTEFCARQVMDLFVNKFVRKCEDEHDEDNIDNFIAAYMKEWKRKTNANEPTTMDEENLIKIIWDLFNAGTATAATTILWCILYALNYPDVQQKIFTEIEQEIGRERQPTMQDKPKLTYLNAFIMEVQRIASVAGAGITHSCPHDVTVKGYTIPQGTHIIMNFDSVCFDKDIWGEDVNILKPERFIDTNGKLSHMDEFIPFGMGRRICPGEGVAKMELFLYLSAMFQKFRFESPNPASPPPLDYIVGLDVCPVPFKVKVIERGA